MPVRTIQHANIRCANVEASRAFYEEILGLRVGPRPPFTSVGYWLYSGELPIVHLVQRREDEDQILGWKAALDHIAFGADDLEKFRSRLQHHGVQFREAIVPRDKTVQLFVQDPDGVPLEFNFNS